MIGRRTFLIGGVGASTLTAAPAIAQRRWRIGVLDWETNPSPERLRLFLNGLRAQGLVDGEHVTVDYRSAEGNEQRANVIAAEFVRGGYDVLVAWSTPAAATLKRAERRRPIVFSVGDALNAGLVSNLPRPEGNLTGISNVITDVEGKRLGLLAEVLPGVRRVSYLASTRDPASQGFVRQSETAGARMGLTIEPRFVETADQIEATLVAAKRAGTEAVVVQPIFTLGPASSATVSDVMRRIALPAMGFFAHYARAGGLFAYGPAWDFGLRRSAHFVARILRGAQPADLPVEQPTEFLLVVNLRTARELGIYISPLVLARADEVIE